MSLAGSRSLFSLVFLVGAFASWAAFNLQAGGGLESCPLWGVQRGLMLLLAGTNLLAALQGPMRWGRPLYWGLNLLLGVLGVITAGRHVLLQNIPSEQLLACLPDMPFMLRHLSWWQALQLVFMGTADCAEVSWTLLDMSLPEWSLLFFLLVLTLSGYRLQRSLRAARQAAALP
ncbi:MULTISPECIES: disulfide bond formation protein B [Pseudomonas]|uniref:disulfide bond formation protein B n=1 Tax=Pseudomonas TaxID=286 RepID=UPI0003B5436A|nr:MULTISPECIES: disulfide bond formation protein B [Pseudomonas]AZC21494.1 Periplasmic thiol:disulfide oxidoreductase DsbB [Pseudomonas sp. CMR5c]ERO62877.1 disulfide bond formation protein DsbB [Pseudomonas piscis]